MNMHAPTCRSVTIGARRGGRVPKAQVAAGLLVGLLICSALRAQAPAPIGPETLSGPAVVAAMEQALVETIARAERSVVAIARVHRQVPGETFTLELRPDPFGRPAVPAAPPQPTDPDFIPMEYATGVIVDSRGLVLTACHVLGEQSDYYITTHDRRVYRAQVKGADPRSDLAVLAFDAASGLQPIRFGDATQLRKGQIVVALGNPYAIARDGQASASWGIVANLSRKAPPLAQAGATSARPTLHHFGTLIQTDAKLNLGTSGGPLLNLRGEMVGLSVALAAVSGYQSAAGYAIPVDQTFRRVVDTLKQGREVEYGFLGVQPVDLPLSERLAGLQGLRVERVVPGTPAARSGLRTDDIIVAVDGRPVADSDALMLQVGRLPAGGGAGQIPCAGPQSGDQPARAMAGHARGLSHGRAGRPGTLSRRHGLSGERGGGDRGRARNPCVAGGHPPRGGDQPCGAHRGGNPSTVQRGRGRPVRSGLGGGARSRAAARVQRPAGVVR